MTSRQPLATLGASAQVPLDPLSPREGALLLERASGRSWGAGDAEPVARLAALCGHLPLALRICGLPELHSMAREFSADGRSARG
ncbi:hypothetical protein ACFZC6_05875 [Streptomyces ossamyceticus]|uniref:Uncharacterized protein n=1 Tax=Streptomyces ossamyceticus TaxID=249581 RepID=A0ABV2UZ53_9ACTN